MMLVTAAIPAMLMLATPAAAPAPVTEVVRVQPGPDRWYGWQLMLADTVALGFTADGKGLANASSAIGFAGLSLGAPILHFANGNPRAGWISLTVRTLTSATLLLGLAMYYDSNRTTGASSDSSAGEDYTDALVSIGIALSAAVGGALFLLVDDCLLARKSLPKDAAAAPRGRAMLVPVIRVGPRAGSFGLAATF